VTNLFRNELTERDVARTELEVQTRGGGKVLGEECGEREEGSSYINLCPNRDP